MSIMKTRSVLIWGDIEQKTAHDFIVTTAAFAGDSKDPIFVYIHTDGGDMDATVAIIDQMDMLKNLGITVVTIAQGRCYSAGAFILANGSVGHRYATQHSSIMIHPISVEEIGNLPLKEIAKITNFSMSSYRTLIKSILPPIIYRDVVDSQLTYWLTTRKAINLKVIDKVWQGKVEQYDGEEFSNCRQSGDS